MRARVDTYNAFTGFVWLYDLVTDGLAIVCSSAGIWFFLFDMFRNGPPI